MYIKFWGTRGSIPTALSSRALKRKYRQVLTGAAGLDLTNKTVVDRYLDQLPLPLQQPVGGNTTCLEIRSGDQLLILDAGSGLRLLGLDLLDKGFAGGHHQADILITHTHWDHIQGFPFFSPAFVPGNRFTFYSPFDDLAERLVQQQHVNYFPVPVNYMSAKLDFVQIKSNEWFALGKFRIYPMRLSHPGLTYGYRIEDGRSCLVIATDSEYKRVDPNSTEAFVEFFREADLLVFDAQYSLSEALDKPDWGHSTAMMGAELAHRAQAKRLALFHHDPTSTDEKIWSAREQAEAYLMRRHNGRSTCEVLVAYDGLTLEV
ncbi:MAG TPA: MBL fold metallo-hydrolase [Anaerolineae bacterium]|nr:MBL fold metallo-hydrolase [Anaerolineae bacterium]MCB9106701.1 MBL fold metallo-hydrolase [Anaerolineales bacterium]HRV91585.1 MBL fold metallo-hydrolase [Anaerolineae bacterium]